MAAPVATLQVLYDGVRNCVVKATFVSGGADQGVTTIVDVTSLSPPAGIHLKVWKVEYACNAANGTVRLYWDDPPTPVDMLDLRGTDHQWYRRFGGLKNGGGPNATGNILVSTQGFTLNDSYTIILEMIKGV